MKEPTLPDCFYRETIRWAKTQQELSTVTTCGAFCLLLSARPPPAWTITDGTAQSTHTDLQNHSISTVEPILVSTAKRGKDAACNIVVCPF